ncbi:MAG: hypothetical protein IT178_04460 [Acidobacteria bacterium]|nr:hypothetical protein [Acidobacteriota bacterium]
MEPVLLTVTLVSLIAAAAALGAAWRANRTEKERAAARVAALTTAAGITDVTPLVEPSPMPVTPPSQPWHPPTVGASRTRVADGLDAFSAEAPARTEEVAVTSGFLSGEPTAVAGAGGQRWLAIAAAVVGLLIGGAALTRVIAPSSDTASARTAAPLELLSLHHERNGANLSVTGLVRNPSTAPALEHVSAVILLLDAAGSLVSTATAPLDYLKLAGGDESPFVVTVAAPASVARYRVRFRVDDTPLPHLDRRESAPVAAAAVTQ